MPDVLRYALDDILGGAVHGALEELLGAAPERLQHRLHFIERFLTRCGDAAQQDESRLDMRVGAPVLERVFANRGHALRVFVGGLERGEKSVAHFRGALQGRLGAAADPDVHGAEVVVGAWRRTRLDGDVVEVEEASMEARVLLAPYFS